MKRTPVTERLAAGLGFTEGPVWTPTSTLMLAGLSRGLIYEIDYNSGRKLWSFETGGRPNGLAAGANAEFWIAQAGSLEVTASIQHLVNTSMNTHLGPFDAPNDLAFAPDGRLWFTDPKGHAFEGVPQAGRIWSLDPATGSSNIEAEDILYPNGLAFEPSGSWLYVAETGTAQILRYRWLRGSLGNVEVFAALASGYPDGIAFDCRGYLYVAATFAGSVQVYDPSGDLVESLNLPPGSFPTNVCFAGPDLKYLIITSPPEGSVYSIKRDEGGASLFVPAK